jgi:hypothetical protein
MDDEGKVTEEITDRMRKLAHVPIQTWKGWDPNDLFGGKVVFCLRWIQNFDRGNRPNPKSMLLILPCLVPLVLRSIRTIMEAIKERKMASHVTTLWKYKPLDQDDTL